MVNKLTTPPTKREVIDKINELVDDKQSISNLVTSVSSSSTDSQYPSAKAVYNVLGDIETLINAL